MSFPFKSKQITLRVIFLCSKPLAIFIFIPFLSVEIRQPFVSGKSARNALRVKMYRIVFQERHYRIKSPNCSRTDMSAHSFMTSHQYIPRRFQNIHPLLLFVVCCSYITQSDTPPALCLKDTRGIFHPKIKRHQPTIKQALKAKGMFIFADAFRHLKGFYSGRFRLSFFFCIIFAQRGCRIQYF